jgi:hypothetical protein
MWSSDNMLTGNRAWEPITHSGGSNRQIWKTCRMKISKRKLKLLVLQKNLPQCQFVHSKSPHGSPQTENKVKLHELWGRYYFRIPWYKWRKKFVHNSLIWLTMIETRYSLCTYLKLCPQSYAMKYGTYHTLWFHSVWSICIVLVRAWCPWQFGLETLKQNIIKSWIYFLSSLKITQYTYYVFYHVWKRLVSN